MKRKWLKVLMLALMAGASFGSPMNPKEIEDLMYIMNQTRIEFTLPDDDDKGDGGKEGSLKHPLEPRRNGTHFPNTEAKPRSAGTHFSSTSKLKI